MAPAALTRPGTGRLKGVDMEDDSDSEFERLVAQTQRNAEDIRQTILGNLRRRLVMEVAALLVVLAAAVAITVLITGWLWTVIVYAIVVPVAVAYGVWSWKRKFRHQPVNRESL
jgi:Flp pilus assembly protein TadB